MIISLKNGKTIDTDRDLSPPERHVLQKMFAWEWSAGSIEQFRQKRDEALRVGWNGSGPVQAGGALKAIMGEMEQKVKDRLSQARAPQSF